MTENQSSDNRRYVKEGNMSCDVCKRPLDPARDQFAYHARLGVAVCCDLTNVRGENVTMHAMMWNFPRAR